MLDAGSRHATPLAFGVAVAVGQGPWQRRRLEEIGGIKPLAAGLWSVCGDGARPRSARC
jgi:hypothetical protein